MQSLLHRFRAIQSYFILSALRPHNFLQYSDTKSTPDCSGVPSSLYIVHQIFPVILRYAKRHTRRITAIAASAVDNGLLLRGGGGPP